MCDYTSEEIQGMILSINENVFKITEVLQRHNKELKDLYTTVQDILDYLSSDSHC